ncbi:MAG: hypothetical protein U9O53_05095 [archaeon]|nr:hypothetical protein [archaeon]
MLETKSLTGSIKNELYDDLLSSIDQEYLGKSMAPPAELVPYMKGKKAETEEEDKKIHQILDRWIARVARALDRAKKDETQQLKILQEIFNSLPDPSRTNLREAIIKLTVEGKEPMK